MSFDVRVMHAFFGPVVSHRKYYCSATPCYAELAGATIFKYEGTAATTLWVSSAGPSEMMRSVMTVFCPLETLGDVMIVIDGSRPCAVSASVYFFLSACVQTSLRRAFGLWRRRSRIAATTNDPRIKSSLRSVFRVFSF